MINVLLSAALQVAMTLPTGFEGITWGMGIEELTSQHEVHKAVPGSAYTYADHMEIDPDVYVRRTEDNKKIEYYFYNGRLYKIYIVYDREKSTDAFYKELIDKAHKEYGSAQSHYQENIFGIQVLHVKWDDGSSTMDLRSGAGYVYQVLIDKTAEREKANRIRQKRSLEESI
ncbi:hypothetical protein [Kaarinaea lacus]